MDLEGGTEWLSLMGDDIQMKKIVVTDNAITASMGTIVKCSYKGYLQDDTLPFEIANNIVVKIGEGDVIPALELSLRHSHVGDTFRVKTTAKFAYGASGRNYNNATILSPTTVNVNDNKDESYANDKDSNTEVSEVIVLKSIPPNMNLEYEVKVILFDDYSNNLLASINLRKEIGNRWYSYGEYLKAGHSYSKGIQQGDAFFQSIEINFDPKSYEHSLFQSYISCLNNLAQCHINNSEFYKAKEVCTKLLSLDSNNIKGLLRAAKSSLALHDYEECELCLNIVQTIDALNPTMISEMLKLKRAKIEYKMKTKALNSKIAKHLFSGDDADKTKQNVIRTNDSNIDKSDHSANNISTTEKNITKSTKSTQGQNLLLMVTSSLVILLISIVIVFYTTYYNRK